MGANESTRERRHPAQDAGTGHSLRTEDLGGLTSPTLRLLQLVFHMTCREGVLGHARGGGVSERTKRMSRWMLSERL